MRKLLLVLATVAALVTSNSVANAQQEEKEAAQVLDLLHQKCSALPKPPSGDGVSICGVIILSLQLDIMAGDAEAAKKDMQALQQQYPQFFEAPNR